MVSGGVECERGWDYIPIQKRSRFVLPNEPG